MWNPIPQKETEAKIMEYKFCDEKENLTLNELQNLPEPELFADLTTDEHLDIIEALLKDVLKILDNRNVKGEEK